MGFKLGAPKTAAGGRWVELPPFLDELLEQLLATHDVPWVFCTPSGARINRANFDNRVWRPTCDGEDSPRARREPIWPGPEMYELRHSHETWLKEDGCEKLAVDERAGHVTPGMEGVYGHATDAMRAKIVVAL